ncbi:EF-hand and coiled-coil domain-containing protein 1 [Collichthys lucidus]|uniref:EF-hand and coiled-coil domain-containing protein 1 n=1 Tax=Collichthys lucidus TaxID=240159 RepID=A0A4U5UA86_COLLU|nr:EF-hand and coiled-coil domain-containing protein 1 [Collichthys lucidus]
MMDAIDSIDPYSRTSAQDTMDSQHSGLPLRTGPGSGERNYSFGHRVGSVPAGDFPSHGLSRLGGMRRSFRSFTRRAHLQTLPRQTVRILQHQAGCQYENGRLLVGKDSEHIETQIRLRSPLRRREKLLSVECYEEIVALEEAEDRISKLEDENASLRELIEDMRAALQSSDARCLALQVGLWKSHSKHKPEEGCFVAHQKQAGQKNMSSASLKSSTYSNLKSLQNIIHEIELLRSSRDRQVEEAMLCNQRLEQELWSSKETVAALEDCNQALKREQVTMRRKVEEARQALLSGLGKVKELETKASHVPALQRHILQLESELLYYRSEVSKLQLPSSTRTEQQMSVGSRPGQRCCSDSQHDRCSPTGRAVTTPDKMEEQLFRSVEGQAASDEEEDKWTGDQQRQVDEVKRILTRLSCCGERCDDKAFKKLMSNFGSLRSEESCSAVVELLERVTRLHKQLELKESQAEIDMDQMKDSLVQELQQKAEETELLQMELQMLETERVRLSLVEEKLVDILQLLQQLRDLVRKAHILEVLNALYHELAACEILSTGGPLERTQSQQSLNALVITC